MKIEDLFADKNLYEYDPKYKPPLITDGYLIKNGNGNIAIDIFTDYRNVLFGFDLKDSGIVVAGGCFTGYSYQHSDVDLFVIANSETEARNNIIKILTHYKNAYDNCVISVSRNCITIKISQVDFKLNKLVQIVCRYYPNIMALFDSFDQTPGCICDNGYGIFMNAEARYAISTGTIVYNPIRKHNYYAFRLYKYIDRGFGILFDRPPEIKFYDGEIVYALRDFNIVTSKYYSIDIDITSKKKLNRSESYYQSSCLGSAEPKKSFWTENMCLKTLHNALSTKDEGKLIARVTIDDVIEKLKTCSKIVYNVSFKTEDIMPILSAVSPIKLDIIPKFLYNFKIDIIRHIFDPNHDSITKLAQRIVDKYGSMDLELRILQWNDQFWNEINPVDTSDIYSTT